MPVFSIQHPDAAATREHMEQIIVAHGKMAIISHDIAKLTVSADNDVIENFQNAHPHWVIKRKSTAELNDREYVALLGAHMNPMPQ